MQVFNIPEHFNSENANRVYRVDYQKLFNEALLYQKQNNVRPAQEDKKTLCLVLVDVQNTFCIPGFELFVAGRDGNAAVLDNIRLCRFIYNNLDLITDIMPTMDTHYAMQIFHSIFFIDEHGNNPSPMTLITLEDLESRKYRLNPGVVPSLGNYTYEEIEDYIFHYVRMLRKNKKYDLIIWPYHGILGGIGHSLVSIIEEAVFFHNIARYSQSHFEVKGSNPLSENYSVFKPEVLSTIDGKDIKPDHTFLEKILKYDRIVFAGQAKSHCLAWTLGDLKEYIEEKDKKLTDKIYILKDCTSPVVVPGIIDFTDSSNKAFREYEDFGFTMITSEDRMDIIF